jgi:hypothetical protein
LDLSELKGPKVLLINKKEKVKVEPARTPTPEKEAKPEFY